MKKIHIVCDCGNTEFTHKVKKSGSMMNQSGFHQNYNVKMTCSKCSTDLDLDDITKDGDAIFGNKIKAAAVLEFVNVMVGAFEAGFVDKNNPTLAEIYQVARHHINDNYGVESPNIIEMWGDEVASSLGSKHLTHSTKSDTV